MQGLIARSLCLFIAALLPVLCAVAAEPSAEPDGRMAGDWPEFRGPWSDGHVRTNAKLPTTWSEVDHIKWKTEIPHKGWSTPVVLGNDIWLTAATEDGHDYFAYCVEADTGKIRFEKKLFHCDEPEPLGNGVNCYASPSPVIEPGRVYISFGSYGTACLNTESGDVIWQRDDLKCRHYRGPGSSAILVKDLLVLTFDGVDQQYVIALNKKTGETVWKTPRTTKWSDLDEQGNPKREGDMRKAYSTPFVVVDGGQHQLITPGSAATFAYNPDSGAEIWTLRMPGYTPAARPVYSNGIAYIASGRGTPEFYALRIDGKGDVTDTNIAWKIDGPDVPLESSPILADDLLYLVSNSGVATCLEATTGEVVWSERLGGNFVASPICAGDKLYFCNMQGSTSVVKTGRTYERLAENTLDEGFMASPAVKDNALILRTKTHLYRIEE